MPGRLGVCAVLCSAQHGRGSAAPSCGGRGDGACAGSEERGLKAAAGTAEDCGLLSTFVGFLMHRMVLLWWF